MTDEAALIGRYQHAVYYYLRHLGCVEDAALDLTQEAFVVLLTHRDPPPPERALAFLRTTARNLWQNWLRARRREPVSADWIEIVDRVWDEARSEDERLEALRRCLETLGPRARQGIALFYGEGASRVDLAHQLHMTVEGVKTLLRRARAALGRCVSGMGTEVTP